VLLIAAVASTRASAPSGYLGAVEGPEFGFVKQPVWHRALRWLATVIVYGSYRSVEVKRPEADYSRRPVIVVANHFAGFADPVLFFYGVARRPRFLAKATLWNNPALARVLDLAGAIPVHRAADGSTEGNVDVFEACHEVLKDREVIALFPEGTTHDDAAIAPIKTGAARIALGARAVGATDIIIVPVGIHYEDKAGFRSRVFGEVGEVIDLDEMLDEYVAPGEEATAENREAVRRLTADIHTKLRAVSPDYRSAAEWDALGGAAEVTLRTRKYDPSEPLSYGEREEMANRLSDLPSEISDEIVTVVTDYRDALRSRGLRDEAVAAYARVSGAPPDYATRGLLGALGLAPTAIAGLIVNAVPMAVMAAIKQLDVAPVTMATIRTLAAPAVYLSSWAAWASFLGRRFGRSGRATAWGAGIIGGWASILAVERVALVSRAWLGWRRARHTPDLPDVIQTRRLVVNTVEDALAAD
jgi:1-acyl-sn-glycerol-3-phosphate acyltransferase